MDEGGGGGGGGRMVLDESLFVKPKITVEDDDDYENPMDLLLPHLKNFHIVHAGCHSTEVRDVDLKELAHRWNYKIKDPKRLVPSLLMHMEERESMFGGGTIGGANGSLVMERGGMGGIMSKFATEGANRKGQDKKLSMSSSLDGFGERKKKKKSKVKNFMGLPGFAYETNSAALVYQARKTTRVKEIETSHEDEMHALRTGLLSGKSEESASRPGTGVNNANKFAAQRKVATALLTMASNETMSVHFMHKGGVEAVLKLIMESTDNEVLTTCVKCLIIVTKRADYCKVLVDKHILSNLQALIEKGDGEILLKTMQVITFLTYQESLIDALVLGGVIASVQAILSNTDRLDTICYIMISVCNVAAVLQGADAELATRICFGCAKKLDINYQYENACFVVDIFVNFTRAIQYGAMLCEEGILPLFLHLLELYQTKEMVGKVAEGFVNLTCTRKNRREIASSGIALHLDKIFVLGTPNMRAHTLTMVGNLLSSGFFHDKIARDEIINMMLENMLDPKQPKQFTAVSYCISQLAQVETSANVLVRCGVISITLGLFQDTPDEAIQNMWMVLVALSQNPKFFESMVAERALVQEMYKEVMDETSKQVELVAQLAYNLTLRPELYTYLSQDLIEMFVEMHKVIIAQHGFLLKQTAMSTLVNFCSRCKSSRVGLLGFDLIPLLEEAGIEDSTMNVKYMALLNIISNEENLCIKLLDAGAQKFIVSLQGSIAAMPVEKSGADTKDKKNGGKLATTGGRGGGTSSSAVTAESETEVVAVKEGSSRPKIFTKIDGELARALTAATLHNLSLKRAVLGPGILTSIMSLLRSNKTIRILHLCRTLANVSVHPRAKLALTKEKRLVPILTATMRSGCDEADRVQHYCALAICNTLASQVEKGIMEELSKKDGAITDLLVCTLLRINSVYTKESMGKALFNLLARVDFRSQMVTQLDVLNAMLELAKIENIELLELCIRAVYNITCETSTYAEKLLLLKIPNILVGRVTSSPLIPGAKATTVVKFLCGMALANMSFNEDLATDMSFDKKLADATYSIFQLNSDEATYCAAVIIFNISLLPDSKNLADTVAIPLLVSIIQRGPAACTQMAVASLCNFSMINVFFDQLVTHAIKPCVEIISAPQMGEKIKMDALQILYNLTTLHQPSCVPAVEAEAAAALWKLLKGHGSTADGNEGTLFRIGRIVKEMCTEAVNEAVQKKLLADGVMSIILKLSKLEIPELKLDLSFAIYSLSQGPDTLKVLQWDGVDVLFWLTLHDCMALFDPIRRNVGRALRNFSGSGGPTGPGAGAIALGKEERSMGIFRALSRSSNEDVQWQAAGALYNMLSVAEAQESLLSRGVIQLLLELAAGGYTSVRHVCSACLHLCPPESMPDLSDPAALQLVLCLLEVDGDKFAELGEKAGDAMPYGLGNTNKASDYEADPPPFTATWVCIACEVDNIFSPVLIDFPSGAYKELPPRPPGSATITLSEKHQLRDGSEYNHFGTDLAVNEGSSGTASGVGATRTRAESSHAAPVMDTHQASEDKAQAAFDQRSRSKAEEYVPVEPEQASQIAFPKIFTKKEVPQDTLGAIYNAGHKSKNHGAATLPPRLSDESISLNRFGNTNSRGGK